MISRRSFLSKSALGVATAIIAPQALAKTVEKPSTSKYHILPLICTKNDHRTGEHEYRICCGPVEWVGDVMRGGHIVDPRQYKVSINTNPVTVAFDVPQWNFDNEYYNLTATVKGLPHEDIKTKL